MLRHICIMIALTIAALAAGIGMVPGAREQWTMLVRDERNAEALDLLESQYRAGNRDPQTLLQLYKLFMSFAQIEQATGTIKELAAQKPQDVFVLTLLADHYRDIQQPNEEIGALERLFEIQPAPTTAQRLLVLYRLGNHPIEEKRLLAKLLADKMIAANDAERLGFMLLAEGDLPAARRALLAFDAVAPADRSTGRLALLDVLLRLGEPNEAVAMAERWLPQWVNAEPDQALARRDFPLKRLVSLMVQIDPADTSRIVCEFLPGLPSIERRNLASHPLTCTPHEQANGSIEIDPQDTNLDRHGHGNGQ